MSFEAFEQRNLPFQAIYYPGENKDLPKPTESVLFTPLERLVLRDPLFVAAVENGRLIIPNFGNDVPESILHGFRLVTDLMQAGNSSSRRSAVNDLRKFRNQDFPIGYDALSVVLLAQKQRPPEPRSYYEELSQNIAVLDESPGLFRARLFLIEHSVNNLDEFEAAQKRLQEQMESVFVIGEENVVLEEDSFGKLSNNQDFIEGLNKFDSYALAHTYKSYKENGEPIHLLTRNKLLWAWDEIKKFLNNDPNKSGDAKSLFWEMALYDAMDKLNRSGYKIRVIFEKGDNPQVEAETDIYTFAGYKMNWLMIHKWMSDRDTKVAIQYADVASAAQNNNTPVNLFIPRGSTHFGLEYKIPSILRPNLELSGNPFEGWDERTYGARKRLLLKKQTNEPVDEKAWQDAFEEFKKYG